MSTKTELATVLAARQDKPVASFMKLAKAELEGLVAQAEADAAAEAPAAERFDHCPTCGFAFPKPQAKCRSAAACERRAADRVTTAA